MLESMSFSFNGISSEDKGVYIVNTDGGMFRETFLPTRTIIEEKTPYNPTPYFMGTELEPITFPISFWISSWKERDNMREIAQWLYQPQYCPMSFECNPEQIYYVMFVDESSKIHNGCREGYITLNVRCNSPFSFSPTYMIDTPINSTKSMYINNDGDVQIYPRMTITKKVAEGDIRIECKHNNSNKTVLLTGIDLGETIEIDFKTKDITSSLEDQNIYRYDNHNNEWLELLLGDNELTFYGDFDVKIEYELMYITEDYPIYW